MLILVLNLRKTGSLYLDDVLSQSAEFILRNLVQHVLTFQNTPGFKIQQKKDFHSVPTEINTSEAPLLTTSEQYPSIMLFFRTKITSLLLQTDFESSLVTKAQNVTLKRNTFAL